MLMLLPTSWLALYPKMRSVAWFTERIAPWRSLTTIASIAVSTTAR
jgi:hypothetical protein